MTEFTTTSPTAGGALPNNITSIGGVVLDLIGLNGVRVVAQLSANSLFTGFFDGGAQYGDPQYFVGTPVEYRGNPGIIGILGGLSPQVLASLGGGLSQVAVRVTLHDGDTAPFDLDANDNTLLFNGINFGSFTQLTTQTTNSDGTVAQFTHQGFASDRLDTGWFTSNNPAVLAQIFDTLTATNQVVFALNDTDPYDNYYDFTQGLSGGLVNVGSSPNISPTANSDAYSLNRNHSLTVNAANGVLANDVDPEDANLSATVITGPAHGTLILNANGSFIYMPAAGYTGEDSFTYSANDGLLTGTATVNLTVRPNSAPIAINDAYVLDKNHVLTVTAENGVLTNDLDPDGTALTTTLQDGPAHGVVVLNTDGTFTYTPDSGYFGTDSFTYWSSDGEAANLATVNLTVNNPNSVPTAQADAYSVDKNHSLVVAIENGVLANDSDADETALTSILIEGPAHGELSLNADGTFTYTPTAGYFGTDSFTYAASDGEDQAPTTVSLTINNPNAAPIANSDTYHVDKNNALSVDVGNGVLANDTDEEGTPLSATVQSGPTHGVLSFNQDGSFTYTPNAGYFGVDSFSYVATDGDATGTSTVSIVIDNPNHAPVAAADGYSIERNTSLVVNAAAGVLSNDTDEDGDGLTATLLTGPRHGTFSLNADGSFTYTPDEGFYGVDSFSYSASDGDATNPTTVTLNVNAPGTEHIVLTANADYSSSEYKDHSVFVEGLNGNDVIKGSLYNDTIEGGDGNDLLYGLGGDDQIYGGAGNDRILAGAGRDLLYGGTGDDTYYVESAGFTIVEKAGEGFDQVVTSTVDVTLGDNIESVYMNGNANLNATGNAGNNALLGNSGANILDGGAGDDRLNGEWGNDTLIGGAGNDVLYGGSDWDTGNDVLNGGAGNDQMYGKAGDDTLNGGSGNDFMTGGSGNDKFVFDASDFTTSMGGFDYVYDFAGAGTSGTGEQDMLEFTGFGEGTTLVFDHYGYTQDTQYYTIIDPNHPEKTMTILVKMSGGTNKLSAGDYVFHSESINQPSIGDYGFHYF